MSPNSYAYASDEEVVFDSAPSAASIESDTEEMGVSSLETEIAGVGTDAQPPKVTAAQASAPVGGAVSPPSPQKDGATPATEAMTPSDHVSESAGGSDYEFVASAGGGDDDDDGSMDELEAEIAAALGD